VVEGLRIAGALWRFWLIRGEYAEPPGRLERLLDIAPAARTRELALALACTGRLAYFQGDLEAARPLLERAVSILRELDESDGIALVLVNLALIAAIEGDRQRARRLADEAVAVSRSRSGDWALYAALNLAGTLVQLDGDSRRGRALCQEAVALARALGDHRGSAAALLALGAIVHDEGDAAAALPILDEAASLFRRHSDRGWLPSALAQLALAELDTGDRYGAVSHLQECLVLARASAAQPGIAMALEGFACLFAAEGHQASARRMAGAAAALRQVIRVPGPAPTLVWLRQVELRLRPVHPAYPDAAAPRGQAPEGPPGELDLAIREALAVATDLAPSAGGG
jgi:tetratricopeptide (TPR) repeat protein